MRLGPDERVLQYSSISFDASVLEIWAALSQGAQLVIAPGGALADLGAFIAREGITLAWLTAGAFHALVDADPTAFAGVRQLLVGGDVVSAERVRAVLAQPDPPVVINGYGPTEAATFTTTFAMRELDPAATSVPIGVPVCNTAVYILDENLEPVRPGQTGELCVGGPGVARGYVGRPELTAERFVPDPFRADGSVMYRTGDRVRAASDGTIGYVGRDDDQVKVRGFRIQLRDVEARLQAHPGIREAVALAPRSRHGDRMLVAFYVGDPNADPESVRAWLEERAPAYLIPSMLRTCEELPLSANGKVDRASLARTVSDVSAAAGLSSHGSELEAQVLNVLSRSIGRPLDDPTANLFGLGLDSISAARATAVLRRELARNVPAQLVFDHPSACALAEALRTMPRDTDGELARVDDAPYYQASLGQTRLWTLDRINPTGTAYNVGGHVLLPGDPDPAAVEAAVARLVERHEILRTDFPAVDGDPVQRVAAFTAPVLPVFDLRSRTTTVAREGLDRLAVDAVGRPFTLDRGPLWRFAVVLLPEGTALIAVFHHILVDGWSVTVFFADLEAELTRSARPDGPGDTLLEQRAYQYRDFSAWQRKFAGSETAQHQLEYWRSRLGPSPRPAQPSTATPVNESGGRIPVLLEPSLVRELGELAASSATTLFPVLLAGLQILLAGRDGAQEVRVCTPIANRTRHEFLGLIGFLGNNLILRGQLAPSDTAAEVVRRTAAMLRDAHAHQDLPFEQVVEDIQARHTDRLGSLFDAVLVFQNASRGMPPFTGFGLTVLPGEPVKAKSDLTISLVERDDAITGFLEYRDEAFDRASAEALAAGYRLALDRIAVNPEARLDELGVHRVRTAATRPDHTVDPRSEARS